MVGPRYRALRLVDRGDHVEWQDGKRVRKWRLPDQRGDYPVLASVVRSRTRGEMITSQRIAFVDPSGAVLAYFGPGRLRAVPDSVAREMLPDDAYLPLMARGVDVLDEQHRTDKEFLARHPEPELGGFMLSYRRHPVLWIGGVVFGALAIASVALWTTGYFANR